MRRIVDNLPLKVLSGALAVVLWFVIAGEKSSEMGISVPLELRNFPADLELTGDAVDRVEVRLRASQSIIQRIAPGEVSAHVDLATMRAGEHIVHLGDSTVRVPFGVRVVKITPSVLTIGLEPTVRRRVPVRPRLLGEPAAGFTLGKVTSEPAEIYLKGPRSRVDALESVFTEPVPMESARGTVTVDVNVGLSDPLVRLEGGSRVRITAEVREQQETRVFPDLEVDVSGGAGSAQPARVSVTLAGAASALRSVRPGDLRVAATIPSGREPSDPVPVTVTVAPGHPGVAVQSVEPAQLAVAPTRQRRKN